ncbi:SH3 and PX domain-containing protein 2A-like [Physella acuta]|uniref:SH3 and PX domain-containing protein 2A-like n=1 Tax=Physella acuta TaxID=109671 RepID=UPI0027DE4100|nr:SH3 and PX domain-containing protein 2A-like [Physella acuta]
MTKYIQQIEVIDAEKRRIPSKHYVYVILVTWSDGSTLTVYRRYSRFFDLQTNLLDKYPIEGGLVDPAKRVIPFLPGKIFFGRSQIKDVAMKRLKEINLYCKNLITLEPKISQSDIVKEFFEVEPEDLDPPPSCTDDGKRKLSLTFSLTNLSKLKVGKEKQVGDISKPKRMQCYLAIADYTAQASGEISLEAGTRVEVVEKSENGWWFVNSEDEQGWVPSTYLEPEDGGGSSAHKGPMAEPGKEENFICIEEYKACNSDEVSLEKGVVVQVIQKNMDGWWLVRYKGKEGYAPGTVLKKASNAYTVSLVEKSRMSGVEIISSLQDVSNLLNQNIKSETGKSGPAGRNSPQPDSKAAQSNRPSVVLKQRSLERGGSLVPPPRQSSVQKMELPTTVSKSNIYVTAEDFTDGVGDGLTFKKGQRVEVTEKTPTGWWFVKMGAEEGWVPSSYLEPLSEGNQSGYEQATDETDSSQNYVDYYEDEDWYEQPEDPEEVEQVKQSDPSGKTASRPLPLPPGKKPDVPSPPVKPGEKIQDQPVKAGFKLPDPPAKPGAKTPNLPVKPGPKIPDPPAKPGAKTPELPSKPAAKPSDSSVKAGAKMFEPPGKFPETSLKPVSLKPVETNKPDVTNKQQGGNSAPSSLGFAADLKAKFEARSGSNADSKTPVQGDNSNSSKNVFTGAPLVPKSKPVVPGKTDGGSLPGGNQPTPKPPPPAKLKPVGGNIPVPAKPSITPKTSVTPSPKPALPTNPPKIGAKFELNNNTPGPTKSSSSDQGNVQHKSALFSPANLKPATVEKPQLPSKLKPVAMNSSNPPNRQQTEDLKSSQGVSNLANSLSGKLNFGQKPPVSRAEAGETTHPEPLKKPVVTPAVPESPLAKTYVAISSFTAENDGELGFSEGDEVEVLEVQGDWTRIRFWDEEGWAPTDYLQKL